MERRPIVTTFPSSDGALRRAVDRLMRQGEPVRDALARGLKPLFPRVAVFERDLTGERPQLYVFRDGHYEADSEDRWWEEDGVACVCLSAATGRLTKVSPEYAAIIGAPPDQLLGRHYLEFVEREAVEAARGMFDALAGEREVTTEAVIRRVDGTPVRIQLHAAREGPEIDVRYRLAPQA